MRVGCVVLLWVLTSCSSPVVKGDSVGTSPDDGGDAVDSMVVSVERDILDAGSTFDPDETELVDAASELVVADQSVASTAATSGEQRTGKRRLNDLNWTVAGVTGTGTEFKGRVGWGRVVAAGWRTNERGDVGYFSLSGRGVIRRIHVGRLSVRVGERLIVGRRFGLYSTTSGGSVADGLSVSPSLSRWSGRSGAALEIGKSRWVCRAVMVRADDGIGGADPSVAWFSLARRSDRHTFGATLGESLVSERAASARRVLSLHSVLRGRGADGAGEVVMASSGRVFYAFRVRGRNRANGWNWGVFVFRAPWMSWDLVSDIREVTKTHQGMRFDGAIRVGPRIRLFGSALSGRMWSNKKRIEYRRLLAGMKNRGSNPLTWEVSVYSRFQTETKFPTSPVASGPVDESSGDLRFRARLRAQTAESTWCQARLDYLPPAYGIEEGMVLLLTMGLASPRIEVRVQAVGHALPPGRAAYITRPGVGSFELFSGLYGKGSDLSARVRFRVGAGATLVFFHGSSGVGSRFYLGAELRR